MSKRCKSKEADFCPFCQQDAEIARAVSIVQHARPKHSRGSVSHVVKYRQKLAALLTLETASPTLAKGSRCLALKDLSARRVRK